MSVARSLGVRIQFFGHLDMIDMPVFSRQLQCENHNEYLQINAEEEQSISVKNYRASIVIIFIFVL